jgi:SlyX protein
MSDIESRIMELEIKNAHQENTIEQLNQIVIQQQETLNTLNSQIEWFKNQLTTLQETVSKEIPNTRPPHY